MVSSDRSCDGRIGKITADVANSYQCLAGADLQMFFDTTTIRLSQAWRQRIDHGIAASTVLIAFISPAYLRSKICRGEFNAFVALGAKRRVVPLIFADPSKIEQRHSRDTVWRTVRELQYLDLQQLRWAEPGSTVWMQHVETIAAAIDEIFQAQVRKR